MIQQQQQQQQQQPPRPQQKRRQHGERISDCSTVPRRCSVVVAQFDPRHDSSQARVCVWGGGFCEAAVGAVYATETATAAAEGADSGNGAESGRRSAGKADPAKGAAAGGGSRQLRLLPVLLPPRLLLPVRNLLPAAPTSSAAPISESWVSLLPFLTAESEVLAPSSAAPSAVAAFPESCVSLLPFLSVICSAPPSAAAPSAAALLPCGYSLNNYCCSFS